MARQYQLVPTDRLWGAVRVWGWIFLLSAAVCALAFAYRVWLMVEVPGQLFMVETSLLTDYVDGAEAEFWLSAISGLAIGVSWIVGAVLTLMWYLRSVRNARMLARIGTSPSWAVWWFILPIVSLWKPYGMTSELWRSSHSPQGWRSLADPLLLRWWWAFVLIAGAFSTVASIQGRTAETVAAVRISDAIFVGSYLLYIVAGLLFLRIGGPISRQQTAQIAERPTEPEIPYA